MPCKSRKYAIYEEGTLKIIADFTVLREGLGDVFLISCLAVLKVWANNVSSYKTSKTMLGHLKSFLYFVANDSSCHALREYLNYGILLSLNKSYLYILWQSALSNYRDRVKASSIETRTKTNKMAFRPLLDLLASTGILPQSLTIKGFNYKNSPIKTLVTPDAYRQVKSIEGEEFSDEIKAVTTKLIDSFACEIAAPNLPLAEQVKQLLETRLCALKNYFGAQLLKRINAKKLFNDSKNDLTKYEYIEYLRNNFNNGSIGPCFYGKELALTLSVQPALQLAIWIEKNCDGIYPKDGTREYRWISNRIRNAGIHREDIELYLAPRLETVSHAIAFILIDVCGNAEPILNLPYNCITESGISGYKKINWIKNRSGVYKEQYETVRERSSLEAINIENINSLDVINYFQESTAHIREYLPTYYQDALFIHWYKNITRVSLDGITNLEYSPSRPTMSHINKYFKKVVKRLFGSNIDIPIKSIRPSILVLTALTSKNIFKVQEKGRFQSLGTPSVYTNMFAENSRRDEVMRDFFEWLEALFSLTIEEYWKKISITKEQYWQKLKTLRRHSFGGLSCTDVFGGYQPGSEQGKQCRVIENCPTCPNKRDFFIADRGTFLYAIQWWEGLKFIRAVIGNKRFNDEWRGWIDFLSKVLNDFAVNPKHKSEFERALRAYKTQENPFIKVAKTKVKGDLLCLQKP